jgi:uncharacterized protein
MGKFIADSMLGKLARWLKIAGLDVEYMRERNPKKMLETAQSQERIILTRDYSLAGVNNVFFVESEFLWEQLREFFLHFDFPSEDKAFSRCVICNKVLEPVSAGEVRNKVPPYVFTNQKDFSRCPECGKVYWAGSHYKRMKEKLAEILKNIKESKP